MRNDLARPQPLRIGVKHGISHNIRDRMMPRDITQIRQGRMGGVEHPKLHILIGGDILHQLCPDLIPCRAHTADKIILHHPLAIRFMHHGCGIGKARQALHFCPCLIGRSGHDPIDHG